MSPSHKRKVQNFLPCKTPTRGPPHHLDATGVSAAHSVTYEDPDVHLGHHPLVMRHHHHHHHHNMEILDRPGIEPVTLSMVMLNTRAFTASAIWAL
ncbi:hypothetical protein RP20_CCG016636 [Aedes albopictus]|nr:hypothetical protein RP20_CCG016636 [Aedes albopictus]